MLIYYEIRLYEKKLLEAVTQPQFYKNGGKLDSACERIHSRGTCCLLLVVNSSRGCCPDENRVFDVFMT